MGEEGLYPASAMVLAGGDSRRMGFDKAFLKMPDGRTLIEVTLAKLASLAEEIMLVTNQPPKYEPLGAKVVADIYPGKGSLGGIYTGLREASHFHSLVVACDMPFLNPHLLRYLLSLAPGYDVVVPRAVPWGDGVARKGRDTAKGRSLHPLHAVYSKGCLAPMERLLEKGDLRIISFYPQVRVRYVEEKEIRAFDPERLSFFNINTPRDLEMAQRKVKEDEGNR